jgi:hypothetical protein
LMIIDLMHYCCCGDHWYIYTVNCWCLFDDDDDDGDALQYEE